jgi:urease accessory protein
MFIIAAILILHPLGGSGFLSGVAHPLSGLDHLLAMIAVGIISVQGGGKAVWKIPATFVLFMVAGGVMAISGIRLPMIESGIALSVLVLGLAIALSRKYPLVLAMSCVAVFALFHGHSHGEEMPLLANPVLYAIEFVLSTSLLHISGILAGHYAQKTKLTSRLLRYTGAAIATAGIFFLISY